MGASSSFATHHPSMSTRRASEVTDVRKSKPKRAHTFSKSEIDSTPKMVSKFDKPYLERENVTVIENLMKDSASVSGGSRPDTPGSIARNEIITNAQAMESGSSQEDDFNNQVKAQLDFELSWDRGDLMPHTDKHVAKFDFAGTTDIELHFKKGNVIQVLEKADNGWWQGVCQGMVGWFPESYVDSVPIKVAAKVGSEEVRVEGGASDADVEKPKNMDETMAADGDLEALEYRAVFTYRSATEGDLYFSEGDPVLVYWGQDNGWWYGTSGGKEPGWFPGSYVEPIIDTSVSETAETAVPSNRGGAEGSSGAGDIGVEVNTKRAPSSDSQDSGVGQEDEGKSEDSGKPSGLQGELAANALLKKLSKDRDADAQGTASETVTAAQTTEGAAKRVPQTPEEPLLEAKPSQFKQPPPAEKKLKPVKNRRQSAPSPSNRRVAPPPPPGGTPTQAQKLPKDVKPSPEQVASDNKPGEEKTALGIVAAPPSITKPTTPTAAKLSAEPTTPTDGAKVQPAVIKLTTPTDGKLGAGAQSAATKPTTPTDGKVPKRRTTAIHNRVTPRRRPPPPLPPALAATASSGLEQTKPGTPTNRTPTSRVCEDGAEVKVETPVSTPIPPPRAKARMKKVKRPTSRMIPPPPNIPLPPPPKKKTSPLIAARRAPDTATKPAHPGVEGTRPTSTSTPKPKPPPPKRISSLTPVAQKRTKIMRTEDVPATLEEAPALAVNKERQNKTEPEIVEAAKEPDRTEKATPVSWSTQQKSSKLTPPKRPPPPRPTSALSNPSSTAVKPERPRRPSRPPPSRPPAPPATGAKQLQPEGIHPRGSGIMGSLKRMVKRDSKKDIDRSKKGDAVSSKQSPQRSTASPSRKSGKGTAHQPLLSEENSPVPKPRSKKKSSESVTLELSDVPPGSSLSSQSRHSAEPPTDAAPPSRPSQPQPPRSPTDAASPPRPTQPPRSPTDAAPRPTQPPRNPTDAAPRPTQPPRSPTDAAPPPKPSNIPRSSATNADQIETSPPQVEPQKNNDVPAKSLPPAKPKPPVAPKPSSLSSTPRSSPGLTFDLPEPVTNGGVAAAGPQDTGSRSQSPTNFYRATKSYTAKADTELSFSAGDTLMFIEKKENRFYYGMLDDGTTGLFPLDAVERFLS